MGVTGGVCTWGTCPCYRKAKRRPAVDAPPTAPAHACSPLSPCPGNTPTIPCCSGGGSIDELLVCERGPNEFIGALVALDPSFIAGRWKMHVVARTQVRGPVRRGAARCSGLDWKVVQKRLPVAAAG